MASAFRLIWFGYIFLFDFRVWGVDVLPDVLGYLLIAAGLRLLSRVNGHFARAARLAPIAALISLATSISLEKRRGCPDADRSIMEDASRRSAHDRRHRSSP